VNEYPGQRTFKAIGTGDQAFVAAMTACVEEVVGTVHEECISSRLSTKGNYISVTGEVTTAQWCTCGTARTARPARMHLPAKSVE
jgi:putative lipoic acid-binding regulatory protein